MEMPCQQDWIVCYTSEDAGAEGTKKMLRGNQNRGIGSLPMASTKRTGIHRRRLLESRSRDSKSVAIFSRSKRVASSRLCVFIL